MCIRDSFIVVGLGLISALANAKYLPGLFVLIQLAVFGLYVFAAVKLLQYSNGIGRLLMNPNQTNLLDALDKQRVFWKFIGIIIIATIVLALGAGIFGALLFSNVR